MTSLSLRSEADTLNLGRAINHISQTGDVITLAGPLGVGKTVLARGFVRSGIGQEIDVASPTFTLVNIYDTIDPAIWHFDLYRLDSPADIEELGLDEALASGISLIEWPDRAPRWVTEGSLNITLGTAPDGKTRSATLVGGAIWQPRIKSISEQMEHR